jgi:uncharacterized protein YndB with AHSA1/START domain
VNAAPPGRTQFQLDWRIRATPARVFAAWTRAAELGWFFNERMPRPDEPIQLDLRVGGAWRQVMVIDQETRYVTGGIYLEIVPDKKLVFAWGAVDGWPRISCDRLDEAPRVTVQFKPSGGGTLLILDVDIPESMSKELARERLLGAVQEGWKSTVERCVRQFAPAD